MITHIGGLNSVAETTINLPNIPGGKKLVYTNIDMELTAIKDFRELGKMTRYLQNWQISWSPITGYGVQRQKNICLLTPNPFK